MCASLQEERQQILGHSISIAPASPKASDRFRHSVSLASETKLAISNNPASASEQAVFIYLFEEDEWSLSQSIPNNNKVGFGWYIAFYGESLYISVVNGVTDGLDNAGSISIYEAGSDGQYAATSSVTPKKPVAGKHFGHSFSFSSDGARLVVGAKPCEDKTACNIKGSVHIFTKDGANWAEYYFVESPVADGSDGYGFDVAVEGKDILVSAPFITGETYKGKTYFINK